MLPKLVWDGRRDTPQIIQAKLKLLHNPEPINVINRLIKGDNFIALHALKNILKQKVKFAYLDPPYNTGNKVQLYSDTYKHSEWLQFMQDRITALLPVMSEDGIIAAQIGSEEMAYLKVLMDEIIGRAHNIGQIAVRMSHSAGLKRRAKNRRLIKNTEYILLYFVKRQPKLKPLYEACDNYPVNYYQYVTRFPTKTTPGLFRPLVHEIKDQFDVSDSFSNRDIEPFYIQNDGFRHFIFKHRKRISRKDSNLPVVFHDLSHLANDEFIHKNVNGRDYYVGQSQRGNQWQLYNLKDKFAPVMGHGDRNPQLQLSNLVGDWWDGFWRDMSRVDREGNVKMKISKKPERLISWLLLLCTEPGDLVLDPFMGTGTTAVVSSQLKRHWIGIEQGDHIKTHIIKRLKALNIHDYAYMQATID